jgi:replicative DNA helicase
VDVTDRIGTTVVDLFEEGLPGEADDRPVRAGLGVSRKLDAGLRGGAGTGELVVCLAGTSIGKTSVLIKSGAHHAERGRKVLHFTLEINTRKVRERYYQAWTGLTTEEIETPAGQEHCRQVRELVRGKGGVIKVIDWSYMKPTANDIGAKVRQLAAQGFRADVIIVDYLMLMAPNGTPGREYRQKFFAIAEESRALARNLDITILSAWQSTREAEKKNSLELQDFAESHDVPRICDIVVGLNANEVMRQHKRMRVQILKQRESTNRSVFELYCDMDRLVVRDITSEDHFDEVRSILEPGTEDAYRGGGEDPGA